VDHVIPRRLGGLDSDDNLVASCRRCNLSKGGRFFVSTRTQIGRASCRERVFESV
jgi:5-methylcytosine-specific restriction endonuclease McrA